MVNDLYHEIVLAKPIEVMKNLWLGSQYAFETGIEGWHEGRIPDDENTDPFKDWKILHACKEPFHRQFVGYDDRGASKEDPEYLVAVRGNRMALNLIDAHDSKSIYSEAIEAGIEWIISGLREGRKVFVHCNMGVSRSPAIVMIVMARLGELSRELAEAQQDFPKIYPNALPNAGIAGFLEDHWDELVSKVEPTGRVK
jgi:predicted protein tyrosine phosphatase